MRLHYQQHSEINFAHWDKQLSLCHNRMIYAQSAYLNIMCGTWNSIISDDHCYMMPLPVKKKWGILYTPIIPFVQQLGIFSSKEITDETMFAFTNFLHSHIPLADYNFNYANLNDQYRSHQNFILPLQADYTQLWEGFKADAKKDLKKMPPAIIAINNHFAAADAVDFFRAQIGSRIPHVMQKDYAHLISLCNHYHQSGNLIVKAVLGIDQVFATAIFLKDDRRIYNIASAIGEEGKKIHANHWLFQDLIKEYAGSNYCLDFEGSDIEGIANFYQQFGSSNQPYYSLSYNKLPWYIKLFKK